MNEEIIQLKKEIEELKAWKRSLEMSYSIPLNIDQSFRERLIGKNNTIIGVGDGGSVNNSTYNSFNVLVPIVTGKFKIRIGGIEYNFLYQ